MQVTREDISETKVKLTVALGLEELTHAKQSELQKMAKDIRVAGFRKGKAPLTVVEQQADEQQLQANIINHAINDSYGNAIDEQKLRTLDQPQVEVGKFVPYTELEFTAEVEIIPKVKLGDYTKIKKSLTKITVSEKEVNDVLSNLLQRSAKKETVKRAAKNGDEVVIDFEGIDDKGEAVAGANGKEYGLELGSKTFIPGFEEALVGVKAGDTKEVKLTFPKEYHAAHLAGTKIVFKTDVKEVKAITLPKADDAFAASVGPFETIADLKKDVKKQLQEQKLVEATNKLKDEIVEELVKKSKFTLPEVLVNDQVAVLEQDFNQNLIYRGITKEEYLQQQGFKNDIAWRQQELQPQAERRVSVGIVLAQVAEQEGLSVTDQELQERISLHKQEYGKQAAQFDQPEMQREVASRLLTEKTVNRLFEIATKK